MFLRVKRFETCLTQHLGEPHELGRGYGQVRVVAQQQVADVVEGCLNTTLQRVSQLFHQQIQVA